MKYKTITWIATLGLSLVSCSILTPDSPQAGIPQWVSDKGYWVVQTNIHTPLDHIIRFYNNDDVMIYQERLRGKRLNTERTWVKMRLKKALELAVTGWQIDKTPGENKHYVSAILN